MEQYAVDFYGAVLIVNVDGTCTADAALTHTTGYNGSVAGHTTTGSEDTLCYCHTCEVFGRGFDTNHHHLVAIFVPLGSVFSEEDNLTACSTGAGGKTAGEFLGLGQSVLAEHGVEQFVELLGLATFNGCLLIDHALKFLLESD